jgi:hypothetical protein
MKKKLFSLISAVSIMAAPFTVMANSSTNVNVNANINAASPSYFGLNFDGVSFNGDVGTSFTGTTTHAGQTVNNSNYRVQSALNFDVYVSGSNFASEDGKSLSSRRMTVNQYGYMEQYWEGYYDENGDYQERLVESGNFYNHEASIQVNNDLTKLYSGNNQDQNHYLQFTLDLTNQNNLYSDNNVLTNLKENTNFSSQVTFTYTGL